MLKSRPVLVAALCAASVPLIAWTSVCAGPDVATRHFLLVPILISAWVSGRWPGLGVAAFAGSAAAAVAYLNTPVGELVPWAFAWNVVSRLAVYAVIVLAVSSARTNLERRNELAEIVDASNDAIVRATPDGVVTMWNSGAERLYGYRSDEAVGMLLSRLFPPERSDELGLLRQVAGGGQVQLETEHLARDGRRLPVLFTAFPIRHRNGVQAVAAIGRDLSEIVEARKSLERSVAELAASKQELERTVRALERINADLEQFNYAISHDLREPLRSIAGYAALAERHFGAGLDDVGGGFLFRIREGVSWMDQMLQALMEWARAGLEDRVLVPVDAEAALDHALFSLDAAIRSSGASITRGPLPTVRGELPAIAQVLQNVVGNAIKFSGDAPPRIEIDAERAGDTWRFRVRDHGPGIAPEDQARIFGLFSRGSGAGGREGSGAGLALAKRIVERHGGEITVESIPGEGAIFSFTLLAA